MYFTFVSFCLASRRFSAAGYRFFRELLYRALQDNWRLPCDFVKFASAHRTIEEERRWPELRVKEEQLRTDWPGRAASYHPGRTQMISLHILFFVLVRDISYRTTFQTHGRAIARTAAGDGHSTPQYRREPHDGVIRRPLRNQNRRHQRQETDMES